MCSMLSVYDIHLPANLGPFHVLSLWVHQRAVKVFLAPFNTFDGVHVRKKYQGLHACTTSMFMFQRVGAWEQG